MNNLLQIIYTLTPYVFAAVLTISAVLGVWLIIQLKRKSYYAEHFSWREHLLSKRKGIARFRNIQFH
jgi:hypothetical protein